MLSVAIVTVWLQTGSNFIFLLTALRGVSQDLMESAMSVSVSALSGLVSSYPWSIGTT